MEDIRYNPVHNHWFEQDDLDAVNEAEEMLWKIITRIQNDRSWGNPNIEKLREDVTEDLISVLEVVCHTESLIIV